MNKVENIKEQDIEEEKTRSDTKERKVFKIIQSLIKRYSVEINDMSKEQIIHNLELELKELKNIDSYISLIYQLESGNFDIENKDIRIMSYKLDNPKTKDCNNVYLGPTMTDDFLDKMHMEMEKVFKENSEKLKTYNKGGYFLLETENDSVNSLGLNDKLNNFEKIVNDVFLEFLNKRTNELEKEKIEKKIKINTLTDEKEVFELKERLDKIEETFIDIEDAKNKFSSDKKENKAGILFGFSQKIDKKFSKNNLAESLLLKKQLYLQIMYSEYVSNMAGFRKYSEGKKDVSLFQEFNLIYLILDLIHAREEMERKVLDGNGKIKHEWSEFFKEINGEVVMSEDMILKYRKKDGYLKKDEFKSMLEKEQLDFIKKLDVFERYYKSINILDSIKNFRVKNSKHFFKRTEDISKLIQLCEKEINNKEDLSKEDAIKLLQETTKNLELSIKDEGGGIAKTLRVIIKQLLKNEKSTFLVGDFVGFGGINQSGLEHDALEIINEVISNNEIKTFYENEKINGEKLKKRIDKALFVLKDNEDFIDTLLLVGDRGTMKLRENDAELNKKLSNAIINVDGGDETMILKENYIPEDESLFEEDLEKLAKERRIRIAVVLSFQKILLPILDKNNITDVQRDMIVNFINMLIFTEQAHDRIKNNKKNKTGKKQVEMSNYNDIKK